MALSYGWLLALLSLLILPAFPLKLQPYADNIARAERYLNLHFDQNIGLVYESDDPGPHWLRSEFPGYGWHYNQTFWLYSDNLFAYLALRNDYPDIASRIWKSMQVYRQPPSNLFEVVAGERIPLPLHNALDFILINGEDHVVMIRRHNSSSIALGEFVDFWMYEALERALEHDHTDAVFLLHQAEGLWRDNGLWDWSFTVYDHMFSNQKLALLLFTARALGVEVEHESEMEAHLWSMQNDNGGIASLSDPAGEKVGSANAETTALSILIYDQTLLAKFPKDRADSEFGFTTVGIAGFAAVLIITVHLLNKKIPRARLQEIDAPS